MNEIAKASARDLVRRLRLASDEFFDLRCLLLHDIAIPESLIDSEYGGVFGDNYFRPQLNQPDIFHIHYFFQSGRDQAAIGRYVKLRLVDDQLASDQQNLWFKIKSRLDPLLEDACWLSDSWGLQNMPGADDGLDVNQFWLSPSTWMWLVFKAAWSCPSGSVLRAMKFYPKELMTKIASREYAAKQLGFSSDTGRSFKVEQEMKKAIAARYRSMSTEQRNAEWRLVRNQVSSESEDRLERGEYASVLRMDPFLASAALIEIMLLGGTRLYKTRHNETNYLFELVSCVQQLLNLEKILSVEFVITDTEPKSE